MGRENENKHYGIKNILPRLSCWLSIIHGNRYRTKPEVWTGME